MKNQCSIDTVYYEGYNLGSKDKKDEIEPRPTFLGLGLDASYKPSSHFSLNTFVKGYMAGHSAQTAFNA